MLTPEERAEWVQSVLLGRLGVASPSAVLLSMETVEALKARIRHLENAIEHLIQGVHTGAQDVSGTGQQGQVTHALLAQAAVNQSRVIAHPEAAAEQETAPAPVAPAEQGPA